MKGLLLKDLYNLKSSSKVIGLVVLFYFIFGIISGEASFMSAFIMVMMLTLPITAISYDERSKWNIYAASMPIKRKDIVICKYILGLILGLSGSIISLVYTGLINKSISMENIYNSVTVTSLGFVLLALLIPVMFKLGTEKGRIIMITIFLIPTMLILMLSNLTPNIDLMEVVENINFNVVAVCVPVISLALYVISSVITITIYENKEL